jgi:ribosomal protein S14
LHWYLSALNNPGLTWQEIEMTTKADECLTCNVPTAGKRYFGLSRNASYAAASRGDIPTIRIGKLLRVPVRALERQLDATLKPDVE